jgi:hypothetical protein
MLIAGKVGLLILGLLLSTLLYTVAFVLVTGAVSGAKATGLPALLYNPLYWLLMILILGGEAWLALHKITW